jgi:HEAT repeat protein
MNVLNVLNTIATKPFDQDMKALLLNMVQTEKAWLKASAISVLGGENNTDNADLFISQLNDNSDRVIFNAAVALGKSKHPKAFETLATLIKKPSWKGQSKMAALTGLRLLGDERAVPIALEILKDNQSPRWFLGASGWDYPVYAATTLASFNKGNLGYEIIGDRLNQALEENDINDVFSNVLLISILADPKATEIFEKLKIKYKEDANAMTAINTYEAQFKNAIKK